MYRMSFKVAEGKQLDRSNESRSGRYVESRVTDSPHL
jgi:hypothetical protein